VVNVPELFSRTGFRDSPASFVYPGTSTSTINEAKAVHSYFVVHSNDVPLSIYVIADLDSEQGLGFVKDTLKAIVRIVLCRHVLDQVSYFLAEF
jgi:hypothetical protein